MFASAAVGHYKNPPPPPPGAKKIQPPLLGPKKLQTPHPAASIKQLFCAIVFLAGQKDVATAFKILNYVRILRYMYNDTYI